MADASDAMRRHGVVRSPVEGLPVSVKDLFDVAGQVTRAGSALLADAAPCGTRCNRRRPAARRRRRDRRAYQHGRVCLRRRGLEPAHGHAAQPLGPQHGPRAGRIIVGRRRGASRRHERDVARHRYPRVGAHPGRAVRRGRLQADGAAGADARRFPAVVVARFGRAAGQLGRLLRDLRRDPCRRSAVTACAAAGQGPAPARAAARPDGRSRRRCRARLRRCIGRAVARRRVPDDGTGAAARCTRRLFSARRDCRCRSLCRASHEPGSAASLRPARRPAHRARRRHQRRRSHRARAPARVGHRRVLGGRRCRSMPS